MPLHIIKLCVGCDSLTELADWQKKRLKEKRAKGQKPELIHVTRMTPKRGDEVLAGGSLYWVIKGQIAARQRLLAFREVKKNGIPHCGLVYDKELVPVVARPRRAFQGWPEKTNKKQKNTSHTGKAFLISKAKKKNKPRASGSEHCSARLAINRLK